MTHNNELHDRVADTDRKTFTHLHVCDDPLTHKNRSTKGQKAFPLGNQGGEDTTAKAKTSTMEVLGLKWELLIRDLCQKETDSIHDMHSINTNTYYYLRRDPWKVLQGAEK